MQIGKDDFNDAPSMVSSGFLRFLVSTDGSKMTKLNTHKANYVNVMMLLI